MMSKLIVEIDKKYFTETLWNLRQFRFAQDDNPVLFYKSVIRELGIAQRAAAIAKKREGKR